MSVPTSVPTIFFPKALADKISTIAIDGMPIEISSTDEKLNELKDHLLASVESNLKNIGITEDEIKNAKDFIDCTCENKGLLNKGVNTARFATVLCTAAEIAAKHGLFRLSTRSHFRVALSAKIIKILTITLKNNEKTLVITLHRDGEDRDGEGILFRAQSYAKGSRIRFNRQKI